MTIKYRTDNFKKHLARLRRDVYEQPPDPGHASWALDGLKELLVDDIYTVLDVGCGQGFMEPVFKDMDIVWEGVTLGEDFKVCAENGLAVHEADVSFLPLEDNSYDLVFARHILEHSPCPVPALMEWRRVSKRYLILIAPAPDYWGYKGKNHYSVAQKEQLHWWLERAGWSCIQETVFTNGNPLFLKHWREGLINAGHLKGGGAEAHFPEEPQDVEYRFLCQMGEEVLT